MKSSKIGVMMVALMLACSTLVLADNVTSFPMDFASGALSGGNQIYMTVGGNVLAVSVHHDEDADAYVVDVEANTVTDPSGQVFDRNNSDFSDKLDEVISILNEVKSGNESDADKIENTIDFLAGWR